MKKQESVLCLSGLLRVIVTLASCATLAQTVAQTPPQTLDQGSKWNNSARDQFYSQDQGSQMIPLKWIKALKQSNGQPFMSANLDRYGYLPNPASPLGLPVGFTTNTGNKTTYVGMTCAACHTRQIDVAGKAYRVQSAEGYSRTIYHLHQEQEFTVPQEDAIRMCRFFLKKFETMYLANPKHNLPYTLLEVRFTPAAHELALIGPGRDAAAGSI